MKGLFRGFSIEEQTDILARWRKGGSIKAVLAYDDGYSYSETAKILLLDEETIRRYINDYHNHSEKLDIESGGSQCKLTEIEAGQLISDLSEINYLHVVKDICYYVKREFGKNYSISGMTKWLHNTDFTYKKPHAVPAKANLEQQQEFMNIIKRLKSKAGNKEPIYFAGSENLVRILKCNGYILTLFCNICLLHFKMQSWPVHSIFIFAISVVPLYISQCFAFF
jgi:transposase